MASTLIIY
jgi:hypothetical protein